MVDAPTVDPEAPAADGRAPVRPRVDPAELTVPFHTQGFDAAARQARAVYRRHGVVICQQFAGLAAGLAPLDAAIRTMTRLQTLRAGLPVAPFEADPGPRCDASLGRLEAAGHHYVAKVYDLVNSHPSLHALTAHPNLETLVDLLLNDQADGRLLVNGFQLRMDQPGNETELLGWHRDIDYFPGMSPHGGVLWIPLADVNERAGTISIIPERFPFESVQAGVIERTPPGRSIPQRRHEVQNVAELLERRDPVKLDCKRGDLVFFNMLMVHRSEPNHSEAIRWSVQLRWYPADDPGFESTHRHQLERAGATAP